MPAIYLSCATEDDLIEPTQELRDHILAKGFSCEYHDRPGGHTWDVWAEEIVKVLDWLKL